MTVNQQPAFSICIPNYNYAHYIGETIQSVLDQTYPHFEIVVVDNASTDDSVAVIQSFNDDRIHLSCNEYNVGFAPNLDRAAQKADNPYIIMLSSDDLMRPSALEEYARVIAKLGPEADHALIVSAIDIIDSNGTINRYRDRQSYYTIEPDPKLTSRFSDPYIEAFSGLRVFKEVFPRGSVPGHFCTTLYSRRLYERIGGYSSIHPTGPDSHLDYKALLQDATVVFINKALFAYRVHTSNQFAQSRKSLKLPINVYMFSIQYSQDELARAGVQPDEMAKFLVDGTCLKGGLEELRYGSSYQAFRYLMFALASYPGITLRNWKAYGLTALLLMGPFGPMAARALYKAYKKL